MSKKPESLKAVIHTLPDCPWCVKAKKLLKLKGFKYEEIKGKSPKWETVPYIEINHEPVGGYVELAHFFRHVYVPR